MSGTPKVYDYKTLRGLTNRLRDDLNNHECVLLFAHNGTGKTRLSMSFKDTGKKNGGRDTLYFNAFTEDLFRWDNDLDNDTERRLHLNDKSEFFSGFKELSLEEKIFPFLERYADFNYRIDYENWYITFSRDGQENIKISRGEENIFIWSIFLAICELTIEGHGTYSWVKNFYIDDPISSLDDNNAIAVASDLAKLLKTGNGKFKTVISTHHGLFFNVMWNEFRSSKSKCQTYFYHRPSGSNVHTLRRTNDTPFLHHVANLTELKKAVDNDQLYTHHFNMLRSIMEKTATFFGFEDFSTCIHGVDDEVLYARALNLLSHGKYSIYQPMEMVDDTKKLFKSIFDAFLDRYRFELPEITKRT